MNTFNPNGFKFLGSNIDNQLYYWDPRFHGFAGDIAVQSILTEETSEDTYAWVVTPPLGGIAPYSPMYPAPVMNIDGCWEEPYPELGDVPVGITPKGVILGFTYCPANGGGNRISVKNFDKDTLLYPFTFVEVRVTTDQEKTFQVQTNSPYGYKSTLADNNYLMVNGLELYTVEVEDSNGNTLNYSFPMGDLNDNTGGSRCYLFQPYIVDSETMLESEPVVVENLTVSAEVLNLTSGMTDNQATENDVDIYPYVYVDAVVGYM